jgi:osmoprotectant transport system permease protein
VSALGELVDYVTTGANWEGRNGITQAVVDHVRLSAFSLAVAVVVAVPVAVFLGHVRRGGVVAVALVNIGRAVPTFAIVALALPFSLRWGFGLGFWPSAVALVLLAIPPIFTNTYTGVRDVDPGVVESARGMGMRGSQVLTRAELPNALPLIVTGLRVSAVQVVATATLAALVGYGGLGSLVVRGMSQRDDGKLLTGAVLVALLAVLTELLFGVVERRASPWHRRRRPLADELIETVRPDTTVPIA